jgi:hypothetical protein
MTTEKYILELLIESDILGIRTEVLELSRKIKENDPKMDINTSIEIAFNTLKGNV